MKYLKARRGQAFETMMLVISVIVALAILAVLLNILNIVKIFNPSDPKDSMSSGLKNVQAKGFGISSPQKVTFSEGNTIYMKEVIQEIPVTESDVQFSAHTSVPTTALAVTANKIVVEQTLDIYVVVCGDESRQSPPFYCISLGRTAADSTATCEDACGLSTSTP
ncbi:hypothetical protein KJ765_06455 [Candidatus Micrarchaeota archaeon]|nr:hypothetical protein [Candidatus Micrarchaeota archaeon]